MTSTSPQLFDPLLPKSAWKWVAVLILLIAAGAYLVAAKMDDQRSALVTAINACRGECFETGRCGLTNDLACLAVSDGDCRQAKLCTRDGRCTLVEGACQAASASDCAASSACKNDGRCWAVEGLCVATAEHCNMWPGCAEDGRCTLSAKGECAATESVDCAASARCKRNGFCEVSKDRCGKATAASCLASTRCRTLRYCAAFDGHCTEDAPTCAESAACTRWGHCEGGGLHRCAPKKKAP